MPIRRNWTDQADATIKAMRATGATWAAIGAALGLSRNTVIERGRRIRAAGGPQPVAKVPRSPEEDPNRGALPAGHEITWGLLIEGTVLEGTPYRPPGSPRRETGDRR